MQKPWRDETSTIGRFPRCASYLKGMGVNVEKHPISNYYAAVILADKFDDAKYEKHKVDFSSCSGSELLTVIERMFYSAKLDRLKKPAWLSESLMVQLMAFLGSRGVKTSMLENDDDVWKAALTLWPKLKKSGDMANLVDQIKSFSKAQRKVANENLKKLPKNWIAQK